MVLRPHNNRSVTPAARNPAPNATAAAQQDGFMREVDEAVREQQLIDGFKRYGLITAVVVVAVLIAFGGYLFWEHGRTQAMGENGEQLTVALDQVEGGKLDPALAQLTPLAGKADATGAAAQMMRAGILAEQNKPAEAQKAFAAVAANDQAPQPFRDLATVREVALGFDAMPADQAVARLKPLAVPGKPFFGSAGELLGIAYMKQGHNDLAGPLFAAISRDKTVPESLRRRARQLAGLLGVDAIDDVNEAAGSANGAPPAPAAQ